MSDYIKREDAIKEANTWSMFGNYNLESRLKGLPSADVVEVRHGHWDQDMECSICGCLAPVSHVTGEEYAYKYCPNCGARMDGEKE